jgi:signal transduction histidine kinase
MTRRRRLWLSALGVVPVLLALGLAGEAQRRAVAAPVPACRVLSNHMVPVISSRGAGCALEPYDRVLQVAPASGARRDGPVPMRISRAGVERRVEVPLVPEPVGRLDGRLIVAVLLASILVGMSLLVLWCSSSQAATPFLCFNTCVAAFLTSQLCGRDAAPLEAVGLVAGGLIPATIVHLATSFPRERGIARRVPQLLGMVYAANALLVLVAAVNFHRSPAVWVLADRVLNALALVAWGVLVLQCLLAARESDSTLERTRAQVLLWGTLLVPALPLLLGLVYGTAVPGGSLSLMTLAVAAFPLPVGYAIAHYRLFDVGLGVRRAFAHALYAAVSAGFVCATGVGLAFATDSPGVFGDPALLAAIAFVGLLVADPLRSTLWGVIDRFTSPWIPRLQRLADRHAHRMAELLEPDQCVRLLCETVRDGLGPKGVSGFLAVDRGWRLAHALGTGVPLHASAAAAASAVVIVDDLVYLAGEEETGDVVRGQLAAAGVELVAALRSGDETLGLLLVGGSRRRTPYTSHHLAFAATALKQSAVAILNAQLARELMTAERFATLGRVSAGLVHDLGKPLGVIERLAARLPARLDDPPRLRAEVRTIASLAAEMRTALTSFRAAARGETGVRAGTDAQALDAVVDRAVQIVARSHGVRPVSLRLPPELPAISGIGETLLRILVNLLDNAMLASDADDVIEVSIRSEGRDLAVEVVDRGCGMDAAVAARAFEPFFSTRPSGDGSGLGLAICRDLLAGVNGRIRLDSQPGAGTRVACRMPAVVPAGARDG